MIHTKNLEKQAVARKQESSKFCTNIRKQILNQHFSPHNLLDGKPQNQGKLKI
jgi:hypothetical protein